MMRYLTCFNFRKGVVARDSSDKCKIMKLKKLISGLLLSTALAAGVGVFAGSQYSDPKNVEAAGASGSLIVKFASGHNWFQSGAKVCAYITDNTNSYWTSLQTTSSTQLLYKFDYSVSFTPTKLIWVRMNPSETKGSWDTGKKWNQTGDLGWEEATFINNGWDNPTCSQWKVSADVRSNAVPSFGTKTTLSTIGINADGNPEVSGSVTLAENEEFKMLAGDGTWSGYYGRPAALSSAVTGGSQTEVSDKNPNIKCLIAGTYDFFFDTETKRLWISRQDIVDADGWASNFLTNVGCDASGKNLPSGWNTCKNSFNGLNDAAKDYIYAGTADVGGDNLGRALATYDHAVNAHPSLERFIKNSGGTPRSAAIDINPIAQVVSHSGSTIAIIVISSVSIAAIGGYFLFKKKKND